MDRDRHGGFSTADKTILPVVREGSFGYHRVNVAVHNFAAEAQEVTLDMPGAERTELTNLLTPEHSSPDAHGRHAVALEPYGYRCSAWGHCST
jgi:hypothetical protein